MDSDSFDEIKGVTFDEIKGLTIVSCNISENIDFTFKDDIKYKLVAIAECCSKSWFQYNDTKDYYSNMNDSCKTDDFIGKTILDVQIGDAEIVGDKCYHCIRKTEIKIIFTDNTTWEFLLINDSNGYYSGWVELKKNLDI